MVLKRNERLISNAAKSNAIVTSLVPDHLRDRLIQQQQEEKLHRDGKGPGSLKTFLNDKTGKVNETTSPPLADLFLDTTVLFADVCGFTAWSSVREPTQVRPKTFWGHRCLKNALFCSHLPFLRPTPL
jgi:class 3 adenylate cyclase